MCYTASVGKARRAVKCLGNPSDLAFWQHQKVQFSRELFMDDYFEISDLCRTRTVLPPLFELTV
jgi:hypothetical protein